MPRYWYQGDPALDFTARSTNNPKFHFNTAAGRYIVLSFFGSASLEKNLQAVRHMVSHRDFFDDVQGSFFGVSIDPQDEANKRVRQVTPGIRFFWDFDRTVSKRYGALDENAPTSGREPVVYRSFTLVLDPMLRVISCIPLQSAEQHNALFDEAIASLRGLDDHAGAPMHAPVLVLPRVFEPEFCRELITIYEKHGGGESGFMREIEGKTVGIFDDRVKKRKDFHLDKDPAYQAICEGIRARINRRLFPEIKKAFQFKATRMERYVVACYDGESLGFFKAHRDDTNKATAHRRFACTINLNTEEYEGGNLRFSEFGTRTYRAPTGGAVIFSCSLMHEATPVTQGKRYAFLPFFYDEAAAEIRDQNSAFLSSEVIDNNKRD